MEERKALAALIAHSGTSLEEHRRSDSGWVQLPGTRRGGARLAWPMGAPVSGGVGQKGPRLATRVTRLFRKHHCHASLPANFGEREARLETKLASFTAVCFSRKQGRSQGPEKIRNGCNIPRSLSIRKKSTRSIVVEMRRRMVKMVLE